MKKKNLKHTETTIRVVKDTRNLDKKKIIINNKTDVKTEKLLNSIQGLNGKRCNAEEWFDNLINERKTFDENQNGTIKFENIKGGLKEVEYESLQELKVIRTIIDNAIKGCGVVADIKTQCVKIPYISSGKQYDYYPDIALLMTNGSVVLIEVKSPTFMYDKFVLKKYEALKEYCNKHSLGFAMLDGRLESFETKKENADRYADIKKVNNFVEYIRKHGKINYKQFVKYRMVNKIRMKESLKAVMDNEDIVFSRKKPFEFRSLKSKRH